MNDHENGQTISPEQARAEVEHAAHVYAKLRDGIATAVVGQNDVVEQLLTCMLCGGHALVVGVPGLAKTLLISTIAKTIDLSFNRIQFTPDLMPSDITGTEVIEEDKTTGKRELRFVPGPIFANVILADEINRTPPKTQAALLEAMQEHQVTAAGELHRLPEPFFVLATQNPIEQEGTYPLPEAQLDRFMLNIAIGYPSADEEAEIVRRTTCAESPDVHAVVNADEIARVARVIRSVPVPEHVIAYALRLVRAPRIREEAEEAPEIVRQYLSWGAGPRASQSLILAAKARAVLTGNTHVGPEHVAFVARPVMRHRIIVNFNAEADGVSTDDVITSLLESTPVDGATDEERRQLEAVVR